MREKLLGEEVEGGEDPGVEVGDEIWARIEKILLGNLGIPILTFLSSPLLV